MVQLVNVGLEEVHQTPPPHSVVAELPEIVQLVNVGLEILQ